MATIFPLKQGETRTSHGPIPHPLILRLKLEMLMNFTIGTMKPLPSVLNSMHHQKRVPGLSKTVIHGIMKLSILPDANVIVRKENGAIPSLKLTVLILKLPGIKCAQVFLKLNNSIMLINLQMQTQKWCFKQQTLC